MQRFLDIILSSIALLILSLVFVPIMLILKFTGEGEIFYRQKRIGQNEKEFNLLKFATMLKDSPNMQNGTITIHNDPRVLPFGRFLRKTKLNELPQLINILKGDMSVIGPRPMIETTYYSYAQKVRDYLKDVKPGLSGVGSIVFRDEETILSNHKGDRDKYYHDCILPYKGGLEIWYVKNRSIFLYFILIFLTIWVVFFPKSDLYKKLLKNLPKEPECLLKEKGIRL